MTVKTTGAEWKRFYSDETAWTRSSYHEDEELIVDGKLWEWDEDIMSVSDTAVITVTGGIVYLKESDVDGPTVEMHFKRWRKAQSTVFLSCEAPREREDAVKAAILAAGGKVRQ